MTDTNGDVDPAHLVAYQGVPVSVAILPDLRAAGDQFRAEGHTFSIALPLGGYRDFDQQAELKADPAKYHSTLPSKKIAAAGHSTHGFGRAVDVVSNAPQATINRIMAAHGFHHPYTWDVPHWEWGNALVAADVSTTAVDNTEDKDENMNGLKYLAHLSADKTKTLGWALVGVQFPDGALTTSDVNVAKGWAAISDNGGTDVDDDRWAPMLAAAKTASDDYWARVAQPPAPADDSKLIATLEQLNTTLANLRIPAAPTKFTGTLA